MGAHWRALHSVDTASDRPSGMFSESPAPRLKNLAPKFEQNLTGRMWEKPVSCHSRDVAVVLHSGSQYGITQDDDDQVSGWHVYVYYKSVC